MANVAGKYPMGDDPLPAELNHYWEQFFQMKGSRPFGLDCYDEIFNSPLLFPLQRKREMQRMLKIAASTEPKVVYEIGADKGGGLYHWCKSLSGVCRVIACEIRGTPYSGLFESAMPDLDFLWLPQSSHDPNTVTEVVGWLKGDRIDCLFIDGEKAEFLKDFDSYLPLMSPNGIVFMHDIQDEAPLEAFWNVVQRGYRCERIIDTQDSVESLERMRQGIPPTTPHESWLRHWQGRSCGVGVIYMDGKQEQSR